MVDHQEVSWVVLGITRWVNYPWIVAESIPGFGGPPQVQDPSRGFPGLGLPQCRVQSPSRELPSLEATKGRVIQCSMFILGRVDAFCPELLAVVPYIGLRLLLQGPSGV